jgi:hypothetical protein
MKKGKEIKLDLNDNYSILSGTVDNNIPKAIYINISTWGTPKSNDKTIDYNKVINNIHQAVHYNVQTKLSPNLFIKDKIIVDLDMRKSGVGYGKRSFMNCEVTLYQLTKYKINSEEIQNEVTNLSSSIIDMFDNDTYFTFHKTKKK